jgi:hypothetical protein
MIAPAQILLMANSIAMLCWAALAICLFAPRLQLWIPRLTGFVVPVLFALVYIVCIAKGFAESRDGGFGSIAAVRALFGNDWALLAGWLHYLAFDLFVGSWIVRRGIKEGLNPFLLLLCLPVTFLLGPVGFLTYWVERAVFARRNAAGASV